jgi:hypothetical protein
MFSMSLKSVPFCFVLIAPMLIGVPVAATPGLVPQAEVLVVVALLEADADELLEAGGELLELDELELLQAARTPSESAASVASSIRVRLPECLFMCSAFSWLTAKYSSERSRDVA